MEQEPVHFLVKVIVCVKRTPYSVKDLENFIKVFNDVNEQGMFVTVQECQEVKTKEEADDATFFQSNGENLPLK